MNKKARVARNEMVEVGAVKANSKVQNSYYPRFIKVYRFYSATNEKKEVYLEYYGRRNSEAWLSLPGRRR